LGINVPVGWGFAIVNFVWWIGIGHAGTLDLRHIALLRQAMADFDQPVCRGHDVVRGGLRRLVPATAHGAGPGFLLVGPYPNTMELWRSFAAAGLDVFAVSTLRHGIAVVLVCRAYSGHVDLRDRSTSWLAGSSTASSRWAGGVGPALAPLRDRVPSQAGFQRRSVVSVHTVVSFDFPLRSPGCTRRFSPAILCCRSIYFRLCYGADAGDSDPLFLPLARFIYD